MRRGGGGQEKENREGGSRNREDREIGSVESYQRWDGAKQNDAMKEREMSQS